VVGWGWYYLSTVLDDYRLHAAREGRADDVEVCLALGRLQVVAGLFLPAALFHLDQSLPVQCQRASGRAPERLGVDAPRGRLAHDEQGVVRGRRPGSSSRSMQPPERTPAPLSARTQDEILDAIPEDRPGIFLAMALMGLRPGEAASYS
jgi:hypothetical protein